MVIAGENWDFPDFTASWQKILKLNTLEDFYCEGLLGN